MKSKAKAFVFVFPVLLLVFYNSYAQQFDNPGDYMSYITKADEDMTAVYLSYLSAVGHNKSVRKVEKRRQEVLNSISDTRFKIQGMQPWKGDRSYRDSTVSYIKLLYNVFNEDYAKIVDMEEIAEQSYDAMEAYMLAQEKAGEKLQEAAEKHNKLQKEFAVKYNVTLIEEETKLDIKSKQASDLMDHYTEVYLVFFKPYKQEGYLMDAINKKNIVGIEENKNSMQKFAEEGMEKLKTMKGYNNDPSLIVACRETLQFYKMEATKMQAATDFFMKEDNFDKVKKGFDTKPVSKRTKQDIDQYNKAVNEMNAAVNDYNSANKEINKQRQTAIDRWNDAVKKYLDDYMPVQRKS
ncbi:MAG: hypothetical protein ACHQF0_09630 [Chitinophagales bacterium]